MTKPTLLFLTIAGLWLVGCQNSGSDSDSRDLAAIPVPNQHGSSVKQELALMQRDFGSLISTCTPLPYKAGDGLRTPGRMTDTDQISTRERMLITGWSSDSSVRAGAEDVEFGMGGTLSGMMLDVGAFHRVFGRLPRTGAELAMWRSAFHDPLSERPINSMTDREILESFGSVINPVTGHFFGSFESQEWNPGGITVTRVTDCEQLEKELGSSAEASAWFNLSDEGNNELWVVKVYGDQEGEYLGAKPIVLVSNPDSAIRAKAYGEAGASNHSTAPATSDCGCTDKSP